MRLRHAVAACALAGCGSVSDNSNNLDAAVIVDTTAPMLVASGPANMSKNASVLTPISLFFDEPLDAASVTAENVKVTYSAQEPNVSFYLVGDSLYTFEDRVNLFGEQPIAGTVSYQEVGSKVSFVPSAPLPHGLRVTVTVGDVKDVAGNAFGGTSVTFATSINTESKRFSFFLNGPASGWQELGPDANGRPIGRRAHGNAGPDGIWHTMDDPVTTRIDTVLSEDGRFLEEVPYASGPDAILLTPDDVPGSIAKYTYDAMNRVTERYYASSSGTDGVFGTADDVPVEVQASYYDAMGRFESTVLFFSPGTDFAWRTADDRCYDYTEFEYDAAGKKLRDVLKSCGPDQLPKTADDTILQYKGYLFDEKGLVTDITTYYDRGADNVFFTPDDKAYIRFAYARSPAGIPVMRTRYGAAGLDGLWNTADDDETQYEKYTLDERGLVTVEDVYEGVGGDGMWGTPDDVNTSYTTTSYDANGNRLQQTRYAAGADGMIHTADDSMASSSIFDPTR